MVVLVVSDIHANLAALKAVLRAAAGHFEEVWCLGDIVGYGPEPRETLAAVQRLSPVAVAGNHDWGAIGKLSLHTFSEGARDALERHKLQLGSEERAWLDALPEVREHKSVTLCHGSLVDPVWSYVFTPSDAAVTLDLAKTSLTFIGHTHFPVMWKRDDSGEVKEVPVEFETTINLRECNAVVNPGSVGQPRNGNPAAHYALFDTERRSITLSQARYPVRRTMGKMRRLGYPERSIQRYSSGR